MDTRKFLCMAAALAVISLSLTACGGSGGGSTAAVAKTWYQDVDEDGYSDGVTALEVAQPTGFVASTELVSTTDIDCDDTDATIYPGATEVLSDTIDQDCDGFDLSGTVYYFDFDLDGYGDAAVSLEALAQPAGYVADATDCDDTDDTIYPGATEVLSDTIDQDCDGFDLIGTIYYFDFDLDGYGDVAVSLEALAQPAGYVVDATDCDDTDDTIYPGATEVLSDSIDQDCDGLDLSGTIYYFDFDLDGYGDVSNWLEALEQPVGYVLDGTDCDDADLGVNPGQNETTCNDIDDDCDAATLDTPDNDGDGVTVCTDCDDSDWSAFPGNVETCGDVVDNDCDGTVDEGACAGAGVATLMGNCYFYDNVTAESDVLISMLGDAGDIYFEYSDVTGAYVIYNITPGDITASAWKSGLNFDNTAGQAGITLASGDVVEGFDFYAISDAVGVITGKTITYLQGVPVSVDVSLNDAVTGAPIDGLSTMSYDSGTTIWTYDLGQIPDGDFEIHAAEGEDGFVMLTPQPVSFFNDALTAGTTSIAVAKAVVISVPAPGGELLPTMPLFSGLKHPSAYTGHAVELYDSNGTLVWGGFDDITLEANVLVVQNGNEWSLQYDGPALTLGETYELRVYGLKAGTTYDHIISHSEPQHGFFTVE